MRQPNTARRAMAPMVALLYAAEIARWYEEMAPQLRRFVGSFGPVSAQEADDLVQDVFVNVLEHAALLVTLAPEARRVYVYQMAKNRNTTRARSWARRNSIINETHLSVYPDPHTLHIAAPEQARAEWLAHARPDANPEQTTAARISLQAVWDATPAVDRQLLLLVIEGRSRTEQAAALGISEGAVSMRLWRLRTLLLEAAERMG